MTLQTIRGDITISQNGFFINCKNSDLKYIFKELFKILPKHSKVKDMKSIIVKMISSV